MVPSNLRHLLLTFLLLPLLPSCRPESAGRADARANADDVAATGERRGAAAGDLEYEARRLIPGMQAQLQVIQDSGGRLGEGALTGYKQAAGRLVDAMNSDIQELGGEDIGDFTALGDSVVDAVGGGTGVPDAEPSEVVRSAELMKRLIDGYDQRMRAARDGA